MWPNSKYDRYHEIAADVLSGVYRSSTVISQLLEAAESGNVALCEKLLKQHKGIVDVRCESTGDTPLIAAARSQQTQVIDLLLSYSADCTLQNDVGETVLEVAIPSIKKHILNTLSHGRNLSDAQNLLHSAWLGDAVSVKKSLSGNNMLNVNCRNSDGLTPLLLVTRDTGVFDKVHHVMSTEYNPVKTMEHLMRNNSDLSARESGGKSALHLVANNKNIQARKMVSLLLQNGADPGCTDNENNSPLHVASKMGHTAIVVALIEEGNADINQRGGEKGDTPLMLSAAHGHKEATKYLLSKGADTTLKDDYGADAMTLAKTPSLISMINDAMITQQTKDKKSLSNEHLSAPPVEHMTSIHPTEDSSDEEEPQEQQEQQTQRHMQGGGSTSSFFLTERQVSTSPSNNGMERSSLSLSNIPSLIRGDSISSDHEETDCHTLVQSELEADDESDDGVGTSKRSKPATRRNQARHTMEEKRFFKRSKDEGSPPLMARTQYHYYGKSPEKKSSLKKEAVVNRKNEQRALYERLNRTSASHLLDRSSSVHSLSRSMESLYQQGLSPAASLKQHPRTPSAEQRRATLPALHKFEEPTITRMRTPDHHSKSTSIDHLPSISTNMKPIALVSVDAERENLHVQKLNTKSPPTNAMSPTKGTKHKPTTPSTDTAANKKSMMRSKSLQSIKPASVTTVSAGSSNNTRQHFSQKRNMSDSQVSKQQSTEEKVPFLPSVVAPSLSSVQSIKNPFPSIHASSLRLTRQSSLPSSTTNTKQTSTNSPATVNKTALSVVTEDTESSSSDRTITASFALNQQVLQGESQQHQQPLLPPVVTTSQAPPTAHTPVADNQVINYATKDSNAPLSPIWDMINQNRTTDSNTSSDYISSYIGAITPFPHGLFSFDPVSPNKKPGADSGQGESDEDKHHRRNSTSSDSDASVDDTPASKEVLRWKKGRSLGKGAFGQVFEGLMDNAKLIAVKEIELDVYSARDKAETQFNKIQQEVDILRSLSHKNIVQYYGASMDNCTVYIFMEFISGGSLQSILKRFGALDERTVAHYTRQITQGLDYLHNNGIIHRDIKGANIMVTSKGVVKLIDFGCAKRHCQDLSEGFHSVRGTPFWMSPEVIRGQSYGRKSDVWSLGCTVHEMVMTKPPWGELPPEAAMFHIGIGQALPSLPDHLSLQLKNIIHSCLNREPQNRPTAKELLEHPFLVIERQNMKTKKSRKKNH